MQPVVPEHPEALPAAIEELICAYDWDCGTALRVADCESRMDPGAVGWTGESFGLFQIYAPVWAHVFPDFWEMWGDPDWNTSHGYIIWQRSGWGAWDCY